VGQVGQEFQVGNAGKKGREGRVGQVGQIGWYVKVWEGGPEESGGINRKFLYCALSAFLSMTGQYFLGKLYLNNHLLGAPREYVLHGLVPG
jgi:hypothetical protein